MTRDDERRPFGRSSNRMHFTRQSVEALTPDPERTVVVWSDCDVPGFGVRVSPGGRRTYFVTLRTRAHRVIKMGCGDASKVSPGAARKSAREFREQAAANRDPAAELKAERAARKTRSRVVKVTRMADLFRRWCEAKAGTKGSLAGDQDLWRLHLEAPLADRPVVEIDHHDILDVHEAISRRAPISANRTLSLLRSMFTMTEIPHERDAAPWRAPGSNPCRGVKPNPEHHRERYLSRSELERLRAVLERRGDDAADLVAFLLATGCRRGEALAATWDQFDLDAGTWVKPASSTKQRRLHRVPLSRLAAAILRRREGRGAGPFANITGHQLRHAWDAIRAEAGLDDLRIHDLRHSSASFLISAGASLALVGAVLGHSRAATTSRYAHLHDEAVRAGVEGLGDVLEGGNVVPLRRKAEGR